LSNTTNFEHNNFNHHQFSNTSNSLHSGTNLNSSICSNSNNNYSNYHVSSPFGNHHTNNSHQPFELTNRVEVNLPFNQKTAVRVKLDISLDELLTLICKEANNLERTRYELVINGARPSSMQDSFSTYNTKEVTLVLKHSETAYVKNLSTRALKQKFK
jgi:hypothetical protein